MRTELQDILLDGTKDAGTEDNHNCSCGWSSRHSSAYMQLLQEEELWPLQMVHTTISQVLEKLERMDDPTIPHVFSSSRLIHPTDVDRYGGAAMLTIHINSMFTKILRR